MTEKTFFSLLEKLRNVLDRDSEDIAHVIKILSDEEVKLTFAASRQKKPSFKNETLC